MSLVRIVLACLACFLVAACFEIAPNRLAPIIQQMQLAYNGPVLPVPEGIYLTPDGGELEVKHKDLETRTPGYALFMAQAETPSEALVYRVGGEGYLAIIIEKTYIAASWIWYDDITGNIRVRPFDCDWLSARDRQQLGLNATGSTCYFEDAFILVAAAKLINQSDRDFSGDDGIYKLKTTTSVPLGGGLRPEAGTTATKFSEMLPGRTIYFWTGLATRPTNITELSLNLDGSLERRHIRNDGPNYRVTLTETGLWIIEGDALCVELIEGKICYDLRQGMHGDIDAVNQENSIQNHRRILSPPYGLASVIR